MLMLADPGHMSLGIHTHVGAFSCIPSVCNEPSSYSNKRSLHKCTPAYLVACFFHPTYWGINYTAVVNILQ